MGLKRFREVESFTWSDSLKRLMLIIGLKEKPKTRPSLYEFAE